LGKTAAQDIEIGGRVECCEEVGRHECAVGHLPGSDADRADGRGARLRVANASELAIVRGDHAYRAALAAMRPASTAT
jgi:hypothetical protein